jgi:hypothetical protein
MLIDGAVAQRQVPPCRISMQTFRSVAATREAAPFVSVSSEFYPQLAGVLRQSGSAAWFARNVAPCRDDEIEE